MLIDVMYIVGNGSRHGDLELRWSLRALSRFASGVGRVLVAGRPPEWLAPSVERIPIDPPQLPGRNRAITANVLEGVLRSGLTGDFILGIDDVFLLETQTLDAYSRFVDAWGLPSSIPQGVGNPGWWKGLISTREFLLRHGLTTVNFMTHAHARMNADDIRENAALIRDSITDTDRGCEILTLVGNLSIRRDPKLPLTLRRDVKCAETFDPLAASEGMISISDKTFADPLLYSWADGELPRCPWEADDFDDTAHYTAALRGARKEGAA